jgi:hypothetical protein
VAAVLIAAMTARVNRAADTPAAGAGTAAPNAAAPAAAETHNTLTEQEKADGWVLLFDGKTTAGWRQLGLDTFPAEFWVVKDGCLVHLPGKSGGKDIIYNKPVENFELTWEWRVPKKNGNSGVKYRVQETKGKSGAYGPEYQMMNDPGVTDKHATGSLYDLLPPKDKTLAPDGQFNHSRIIVRGNKGEHWLNGKKTVEFEFWSESFNAAHAQSKFRNSPIWGKTALGYIALTDHSDEAHFRNIKLRELK